MNTIQRILPIVVAAGVVSAATAPAVQAQPSALMAAAAPPASDATLYEALGGRFGLTALMDDFMRRLVQDPRTRAFFADADQAEIKKRLVEQFCVVSGGPCTYGGKDMKKAHEGVDIDKSQFNALVEVLQTSMDARGIPFGAQNRLLAKLAPMHREVINR